MFLYLVICFLRVAVSSLCRSQAVSNIHVPIYPHIQLVKEDEIVRACDRLNSKTVTSRKHVTKYINMRKWMVEFLRKSDSRDDKIARVNPISITKSINFFKKNGQHRTLKNNLGCTAKNTHTFRTFLRLFFSYSGCCSEFRTVEFRILCSEFCTVELRILLQRILYC